MLREGQIRLPPALRLSISADLAEVRKVAAAARGFLTEQGCAETEITDCELALVEACNNAIQYAPEGFSQGIEIEVACSPKEIELRIVDHTPGFDWPEKAKLPEPESECGRGVFLIQAVMSDSQYTLGPEGNTLTLRKRRTR